MRLQKRLISIANGILERQSRDGPTSADGLGSELGALGKDLVVHLLELGLVSDPEEGRGDDEGHGRAQCDYRQFPPKVEGDG